MQWSLLGTPEGLQRIQAFVQKTGAEALVTMDEFALLWLAGLRESFEPACRLLAPEQAVIERLRTKDSQCEIAQRAGLNVLPTWSIASHDISQIPPSAYPVCIRPSTYSSVTPEFKAETLHSPRALHEFLAAREWTAPILAQPFISGPNMVVHCCRDSNGRWLELRAYRAPVKSRGFAVVLEESTLPPEIHKACRKFAELSGATGCFHFDMLQSEKDGKVYFLEINLRLGGSTGKVMELGLDEPMYLLRSYGFEPASRPRKLPRARAAGSIRMLAEHARNVLRKRDAEISYPRHNTPHAVWTLLRYAVTLKDPSLSHFSAGRWIGGWLGRQKKKSAPTRSRSYIPLDRVDDGWPCPSGTGSAQA
jgi:hypothetical protein